MLIKPNEGEQRVAFDSAREVRRLTRALEQETMIRVGRQQIRLAGLKAAKAQQLVYMCCPYKNFK